MTILRRRLSITFSCNSCGEELETGETDFREALTVLKVEGWRAEQDENGTWCHYCEGCGS